MIKYDKMCKETNHYNWVLHREQTAGLETQAVNIITKDKLWNKHV